MDLAARLNEIIAELRATPSVELVRADIEPCVWGIDEDHEEELREECEEFEFDDAIRETWSEISSVDITWRTKEDPSVGGSLILPDVLDLVRPGFGEDDVAILSPGKPFPTRSDGGPYAARSEEEREFLLQLHMLEAREADHWTAFRARRGEPLELWYRRGYGRPALDMRLDADFERYLETLLAARGVTGWPLLLVAPRKLDAKARAAIKRWGIPQLEEALRALAKVDGASKDARRLLQRAERLRARL